MVRTDFDAFRFSIFMISYFVDIKSKFITTFTNSFYNINEIFLIKKTEIIMWLIIKAN